VVDMDIIKELKMLNENKTILETLKFEVEGLEHISKQRIIESESDSEEIEAINFRKPTENISSSRKVNKDKIINIIFEKESTKELEEEEIKERIKYLKSKIFSISYKISFMENVVLASLGKKERYIIESKYVLNERWNEIQTQYNQFFMEYKEIRTLQSIKLIAVNKLKALFENKII
jgi:hypothetical protein